MKMPTRYTKTCILQYCRYHTEWPKEAFLPAQFQGVQKGHVDASQDTVGVRHARDVAQDRQYLACDGQRPADGQKKVLVLHTNKNFDQQRTNWVMHQYHLGDLEQEKERELVLCKIFYQTNTRARSSLVFVVVLPCCPQVGIVV